LKKCVQEGIRWLCVMLRRQRVFLCTYILSYVFTFYIK
jgi:hypothetical protein